MDTREGKKKYLRERKTENFNHKRTLKKDGVNGNVTYVRYVLVTLVKNIKVKKYITTEGLRTLDRTKRRTRGLEF